MGAVALDEWQAVTERARGAGIRAGEPFCRVCLGRVSGIVCESCDVIVPVVASWRVYLMRFDHRRGA